MDTQTKRMLLKAQKHTPRYLFRGWRHGNNPSGGDTRLNTTEKITPRAFLDDAENSGKTIYDLTRQQLYDTCHVHLAGETPLGWKTEFSSWSCSLEKAIRFTKWKDGNRTGFISIIDTKELPNAIIHVMQLKPILGDVLKYGWKTHEYLAYGVISGPALKAVPVQAFVNTGAPMLLFGDPMGIWPELEWNSFDSQISTEEIIKAESVGRQYGPKFGAAVMIAILCLKRRDYCLWRNGTNGVETMVEARMAGFDVPAELCVDESIMTGIVDTEGWGEVEQMIRLLRAVVNLRHGRGARMRARMRTAA